MDLVTKNLLDTFQIEFSLQKETDSAALFEQFADYCVVVAEYGDDFSVEDVHTGGSNDLGIDGVAVIVNGAMVNDVDEIVDLVKVNKYLNVDFILCQAKSSSEFSGTEISNYFYGVRQLFSDTSTLPKNSQILEKVKLIQAIYQRSSLFRSGNPNLTMYYVTTGNWQNDQKLLTRIEDERNALAQLNIFEVIKFLPVDARQLQKLYKKSKNKPTKVIQFASRLTLPAMEGVQESYLGYLPINEYIKLITDDSGQLNKGIFYDNVRDFQGDNQVNREIAETLASTENKLFLLMNNGVTVVADSMNITGDEFTIVDYQIVNGCQTSHVIFNNKNELNGKTNLSIKLIVSQDGVLKNKIIKATNRQTPVKTEDLTALTDFQKHLEDYYAVSDGDSQLFYERRSQQYRSVPGIEKIRIVSVATQIRTFASMFLNMAHQASRYYGTLLNTIEGKIFVKDHPLAAYYGSSLALYRIESFLRRKIINAKYRPFKYHLLGVMPTVLVGANQDAMTSRKFKRYAERLVEKLKDEQGCVVAFEDAIIALDAALNGNYDRDRAKDGTLTKRIMENLKQ